MNKLKLILFAALLFAAPLLAQSTQPSYWLGGGAGWNRYGNPQATGWTSFGVKIGESIYSYSTIDSTSVSSSMRTGIAKLLVTDQAGFTLLGLVDGGIESGGGNVAAAFGGGCIVSYSISKWLKIPGANAVFAIKVLKGNLGTSDVQPVFSFGFAKTF